MEKKSIMELFSEIEESVSKLKESLGICLECDGKGKIEIQVNEDTFETKNCPECSLDPEDTYDGLKDK